jgi:transcriptional regulator with XRE-family HTH domain
MRLTAHQQIQKYEKGVNRIGAARLHDFANALNVPVSDLFAGAHDAERKSFASSRAAFDPQAFRIAEAFAKITDKEIRRLLIRLAEAMVRKLGDSAQCRAVSPPTVVRRIRLPG